MVPKVAALLIKAVVEVTFPETVIFPEAVSEVVAFVNRTVFDVALLTLTTSSSVSWLRFDQISTFEASRFVTRGSNASMRPELEVISVRNPVIRVS